MLDMFKEAYASVQRGLCPCQKRPMLVSKEAYARDVFLAWRPLRAALCNVYLTDASDAMKSVKETYIHRKRDLHTP